MRVVLDTNILVSALIAPAGGNPAMIYNPWEQGKFTLLTCTEHLDEVRATFQKPRVANLIKPYKAGRLVNQVKKLAEDVAKLPRLKRSPDPGANFLLAEAGKADFLVTGDKSGLLVLGSHKSTRIITARSFAALFAAHPMIEADYGQNSADLARNIFELLSTTKVFQQVFYLQKETLQRKEFRKTIQSALGAQACTEQVVRLAHQAVGH